MAFETGTEEAQLELKPRSGPPAREYKFTLDPFQERSVLCLDNHQSVLVSAHTSAGKTVVAEYAISLALRDKQRVIYTTPIKVISDQMKISINFLGSFESKVSRFARRIC